jgi:PAS domain S-box-containing protein
VTYDATSQAAQHLAAIVESSDDAIVSKNLNGIITSWNQAAVRMFGYEPAEAIGRSIRMIIPADRQGEEDDVIRRIKRGETVGHFDTVRVRKDGSLLDISLTVSPIRAADGTIVGASKIARDVTEAKRTAAMLAEIQGQRQDLQQRLLVLTSASTTLLGSPRIADVFPAILSLAPQLIAADGYAVWRLDTLRRRWSVVAHTGISAEFASLEASVAAPPMEPVVAEDLFEAVKDPDRLEAYRREGLKSLLALPLIIGGEGVASLVFYFRQQHRFSEVELQTARALANLAAAVLGNAALHDEQRRRELEAQFLAKAGETLASSLDYRSTLRALTRLAVPDIADWCAADMLDDDGTLRRLALSHADPAQVVAAEAFTKRYPPDPDSPYGAANVIRTGESMLLGYLPEEMIEASARDAEHRSVLRTLSSLIIVPLRIRGGVIGALSFATAESRRHYRAHDLRFAETVAGRAALAIENALSYEEARRANRLKDEFLATLSHELRTPLNAILGYTRMLRTDAVAANKREGALETVERNAAALAQIVEDVLDVSRIVSGKLAIQVRPVRLTPIVQESVATVLPAAHAKGVRLAANLALDTDEIVADPDRLRQVMWNLLSNAVKFTSRGGGVAVNARRVADDVEIVVSDTGEGIPPEFLPHVFERFRQADSRVAGVRSGLGIGLAIARHIVEMHGGTIDATSEGRGKGATFRVRLPSVSQSVPTA